MTGGGKQPGFSGEQGTTLLELLVVLAIMVLLAAVAAPQMLRFFAHGQSNAAVTELATVSAALHLFREDVGRYPTTAEGLAALRIAPPHLENWSGPYGKGTAGLTDPWGHPLVYASPGRQADFELYSLGPPPGAPVALPNASKVKK